MWLFAEVFFFVGPRAAGYLGFSVQVKDLYFIQYVLLPLLVLHIQYRKGNRLINQQEALVDEEFDGTAALVV